MDALIYAMMCSTFEISPLPSLMVSRGYLAQKSRPSKKTILKKETANPWAAQRADNRSPNYLARLWGADSRLVDAFCGLFLFRQKASQFFFFLGHFVALFMSFFHCQFFRACLAALDSRDACPTNLLITAVSRCPGQESMRKDMRAFIARSNFH